MSRWRAFVDVLDEILNDRVPSPAAQTSGGYRPAASVMSTPLYSYTPHLTSNRFWSAPGPYRPESTPDRDRQPQAGTTSLPTATGFDGAARMTAREREAKREARAARPLAPVEESALQTLVRLGAALDRHFTSRELRSTFRTLAQRYHPDRHPHASDAERMQLGTTFAELTEAYGVLHDATR